MLNFKKNPGIFLLFVLLLALSVRLLPLNPANAAEDTNQKIIDLRRQIDILTQQAAVYQKNISQKRKEADTLKRQIDLLNNQILSLETQITITDRQIDTAEVEVLALESDIFDTQGRIVEEKGTVTRLLGLIQERDHVSLAIIILQNPRLSDLANKVQQDSDLTSRLNDILTGLKDKKEKLQTDKTALETKKRELEDLNTKRVDQKESVAITKTSKNKLLVATKGKEQEYQKLLSAVERKKAIFFGELQNLESDALKGGNFIVHVTATRVPPRGRIFQWPVSDHTLTQSYGRTTYARRGVYGGAPHNGIDFASGLGTPIKPVAAGKILASGTNNGWGNWVAIHHIETGGLVSIYAHMRSPTGLAAGTTVGLNSIIGYEGSTGNSTGPHVHLSVYRDFFTYINPKNGQLYFNYFEGSLNPLNYL